MSAVPASLCSTLLFVGLFVFVSADKKNITAESGQSVTLTCRAPNNNNDIVEWSRPDLEPKHVLVYRGGNLVSDDQHPSFKNRVDLQDRQMKDGDMSLIVMNLTINDTGTYECRAFTSGTNCRKKANRSVEPISIINLSVVDPPDPKIITAESGQSVTLPCRASNNNFIILEWSRAGLGTQHVVVCRDGQFTPDDQHPSFKDRVDLQDRQMKDGDVSLILNNVTTADSGTYECRVLMGEIHSWELNIIYLSVVGPPGQTGGDTEDGGKKDGGKKDGGKKDGSVGLISGLSVCAVLLVVVGGFLIYRKCKQQNDGSYQLPVELQKV
ncbi:programmed cell death 1 ligand 1-like [Simochromis diagramma]|uniref:programmed cell death 1 ligand 1-like n=1 Tax=Simochromis diagramma TaxID=43689 RepID=UPI001A7E8983|nr:programmed cell death 1 ligand 1-like [Simochromis diagramma]